MDLSEAAKKERKKKTLFILLLLTVPVIWGYGFLVTEDALNSGLSVSAVMAGRFLLAAALLFLFRLTRRSFREKPFTKKDVLAGLIVGAVNFGGFFLQAVGILYTDTAKSGMLTGTYVVIVPVVACILQKKFKLRAILTALVFFIGMLFLFDVGKEGNFNRGDLITLICSVFFAAQILLVDRLGNDIHPVNFTAVQMLVMGVLGLIGTLIASPTHVVGVSWSKAVFPLLYLGLFSSAYAYVVQTLAQEHISPSLTAIILSLEAGMSVIFSVAFGRTEFTVPLAIGCAIMFAASAFASVTEQGKPPLSHSQSGSRSRSATDQENSKEEEKL